MALQITDSSGYHGEIKTKGSRGDMEIKIVPKQAFHQNRTGKEKAHCSSTKEMGY